MPELVTSGPFPFEVPSGTDPFPFPLDEMVALYWRVREYELDINVSVTITIDNGEDPPFDLSSDFSYSSGPIGATGVTDESDLPCGSEFSIPYFVAGDDSMAMYGLGAVFYTDAATIPAIQTSGGLYYPSIFFAGQFGTDCVGEECTPGPSFTISITPSGAVFSFTGESAYLSVEEITGSTTVITGTVTINPVSYWSFGGVVNTVNGEPLTPAKTVASFYFQCPCES